MASDDNVTPEQARAAAKVLVGVLGDFHKLCEDCCESRALVLRYIDQSAARIAELQSLTAWRPIDTAPRDGTRVLLYLPSRYPGAVAIGVWNDEWTTMNTLWKPTHWLPLPAAPEVSNGK